MPIVDMPLEQLKTGTEIKLSMGACRVEPTTLQAFFMGIMVEKQLDTRHAAIL